MACAALLALGLPLAEAAADTRVCRQLEAQLASASGSAPSGQARRYDVAIEKQQAQMRKAREQAQQLGCGRAMFGRAIAQCASLNATIHRMQANLAELQATRAKMGGNNSRRERQRIQAALEVNGCRTPERSLPAPVDDGSGQRQQVVIDGRTGVRIGGIPGNFRTLCVRTCDGYFFPVSYSVKSSVFERDANACKAMCPGTQVELFYHRVPGEESSDMVSAASGLPYSQMPNAFAYRQGDASSRPGCGCQAAASGPRARGFAVIGGDYGPPSDVEEATTAAIPSPSGRPDPAEDPETLASRDGGLDAAALKDLATPPARPAAPVPPEERSVRVVGPVFLPDPEEAIDLRAPAQPIAR